MPCLSQDWYPFQVDKHIRRLDADLARFENDLKDKLDSSSQESSDEKRLKSKFFKLLTLLCGSTILLTTICFQRMFSFLSAL